MSIPFGAQVSSQYAVRLAVYLYYPDGSSAVAEGTDLLVEAEFDFDGHMVDIQAAPAELTPRLTRTLSLRIYPPYSRAMLRVTKRPPVPGLDEDCPPIPGA